MDRYFDPRDRDVDSPFLMPIEDVFYIKARGTVVTGRVERGIVREHDELDLLGAGGRRRTTCLGIEMFAKDLPVASAGDCVGVFVEGTEKKDVA